MISFNSVKAYPSASQSAFKCENRGNKKSDFAVLRPLDKDTVSFSGLFGVFKSFGAKKLPVPKYVTQEVYEEVCEYIEKRPFTWAALLMKDIKHMCEVGANGNVEFDAQIAARLVEKEYVDKVKKILTLIKDDKTIMQSNQPIIRSYMQDYIEILGTGSLKAKRF